MRKVTIKAHDGHGEAKVIVGERVVELPDTLDELRELVGDQAILTGWRKSFVIEVQRQLRAKPKKPMSDLEKAFQRLTPEEQLRVLNNRAGGSGL